MASDGYQMPAQTVIYELVQDFVKSVECLSHLKSYVEKDSVIMRAAMGHDWGGLKINATYGIITSSKNPSRIKALFGEIESYLTNNIATVFPLSNNLSRAGIRKLIHYVLIPEALRYGVGKETSHYNLPPDVIRDIVWYGYDHLVSVIPKYGNVDKSPILIQPIQIPNSSTTHQELTNCDVDGGTDITVIAPIASPVVSPKTLTGFPVTDVDLTAGKKYLSNSQCENADEAQTLTPTDLESTATNYDVDGDIDITVVAAVAASIVLPNRDKNFSERALNLTVSRTRRTIKRKFICLPNKNTKKVPTDKDYLILSNLGVGLKEITVFADATTKELQDVIYRTYPPLAGHQYVYGKSFRNTLPASLLLDMSSDMNYVQRTNNSAGSIIYIMPLDRDLMAFP